MHFAVSQLGLDVLNQTQQKPDLLYPEMKRHYDGINNKSQNNLDLN